MARFRVPIPERRLQPFGLAFALTLGMIGILAGAVPAGAEGTSSIAFVRAPHGQPDIFTIRPNGTGVRQVTDDDAIESFPSWSPSGRRIAFVRFTPGRSGREIYIVRVADGRLTPLTHNGFEKADVAWSPTGKLLAFTQYEGDGEIVTMRPDGTHIRHLTDNRRSDSEPAWSPDGRRIAFDRGGELWIMRGDGSHAGRVLPADVKAFEPDWSPDGWIVFVGVEEPLNFGLFKVHPDGTELTRLTTTPRSEEYPSWSPDGRWIVYSLSRENYENDTTVYAMFKVRADGGDRVRLSPKTQKGDRWPDWSRAA